MAVFAPMIMGAGLIAAATLLTSGPLLVAFLLSIMTVISLTIDAELLPAVVSESEVVKSLLVSEVRHRNLPGLMVRLEAALQILLDVAVRMKARDVENGLLSLRQDVREPRERIVELPLRFL